MRKKIIILLLGFLLMVMGYYAYWNFPVAIITTIITDLQKERTTDIEIPKATSLSFYLQLDNPPKLSLNPKDIYIILTNKQDNSKTFIYGDDYHNETKIIYFSSSNKTLSSSIKATYCHYISPGKYSITVKYNFPAPPCFTLKCQIISTAKHLKTLKRNKDN